MNIFGLPARVPNTYERLPGTSRAVRSGRQRLYCGPNHLLSLEMKGTLEIARRFYYADITALRCVRTRHGDILHAVGFTLLAVGWVAYGLSPYSRDPEPLAFMTAGSLLAGIPLLVSLFRGPTCRTWLHTANHTEPLKVLSQYRVARRALAELDRRITTTQGNLADIEVPKHALDFSPYSPLPVQQSTLPILPHDPRLMRLLFWSSLVFAAYSLLGLVYVHSLTDLAAGWFSIPLQAMGALAIIQSYGTNCPPAARRSSFVLLSYLVLSLPYAILWLAIQGFLGMESSYPDLALLEGSFFSPDLISIHESVIGILFYAGCSIAGLNALRQGETGDTEPRSSI